METLNPIDPYASATTKIFAGVGVLYLSLKIFSFWRLIASLFILPGQSVSTLPLKYSINRQYH